MSKAEKLKLLNLLEEKRNRKAKNSLIEYAKQIIIPGVPLSDDENCEEFYPDNVEPAEHHEIILETVEKLAKRQLITPDGTIGKNVIILAPPGSAKSTYASVVFPTWFMGNYPNHNLIMATYGSDLAAKFGRKCRAVSKSKDFKRIFGCELTYGNAAADDWSLTNLSTYMCGGIRSGITGNRADGLIIDDPYKGREEANSEAIRKKTQDAYKDDLLTRLKPKAWKVIINTRWHELDLCGGILPKDYKGDSGWFQGADGAWWHVLNFQAECQSETDPLRRKLGEFLWTKWWSVEDWQQTKRTFAGYSWHSLFQGVPTPDEGIFFKREWFKRFRVGSEPELLNKYICEDFAVTDEKLAEDPDYTEIGVGGFDEIEDLWLVDWWKGRTEADVWINELIKLVSFHEPLASVSEAGVIRRSIEPFLKKEMKRQSCYFRQEWLDSSGKKTSKALSFQGLASQGKVHIPLTPWGDELVEQLIKFPHGDHDDGVDVCGIFGRILDQTFAPEKLPDKPLPSSDAWGRPKNTNEDWRTS